MASGTDESMFTKTSSEARRHAWLRHTASSALRPTAAWHQLNAVGVLCPLLATVELIVSGN
jgi:hypothetical protein